MSPGPAKQFDRKQALQDGLQLFWEYGYEKVSLGDLLSEMQIGRQSFYNTFKSKADFFDEALRAYADQYQRPMIELLSSGDSPDANVMKFLREWEKAAGQQPNDGCFLVNACGDVPCLREESASLVTALAKQMEDALKEQLDAAIEKKEIASQLSARKIAHILMMLGNGLMSHARNPNAKSSSKGLMAHTYRKIAPLVS